MKRVLVQLLKVVVVLIVSAPIAVVSTWLLMPLWGAVETRGIESVGHSGPAGWCYVATYAFFVVAGLVVAFWFMRPGPESAR